MNMERALRIDGTEYIKEVDRHCARFYRGGVHVGTWIDYEWNDIGPIAELFALAEASAAYLHEVLEACRLAGIHEDPEGQTLKWFQNSCECRNLMFGLVAKASHPSPLADNPDPVPARSEGETMQTEKKAVQYFQDWLKVQDVRSDSAMADLMFRAFVEGVHFQETDGKPLNVSTPEQRVQAVVGLMHHLTDAQLGGIARAALTSTNYPSTVPADVWGYLDSLQDKAPTAERGNP